MLKINILFVGKPLNSWQKEALETYLLRMKGRAKLSWIPAKNDQELQTSVKKYSPYYCLDSKGSSYTSENLAKLLTGSLRWNLVIGGHEGLPTNIKEEAKDLISLSSLTFPHEMVRIILAEQIYRSLEIACGGKYHK